MASAWDLSLCLTKFNLEFPLYQSIFPKTIILSLRPVALFLIPDIALSFYDIIKHQCVRGHTIE